MNSRSVTCRKLRKDIDGLCPFILCTYLAGEIETGRAAVANQLMNTLIRAIEQERKMRELGELAERLEALEEVLRGRRKVG